MFVDNVAMKILNFNHTQNLHLSKICRSTQPTNGACTGCGIFQLAHFPLITPWKTDRCMAF